MSSGCVMNRTRPLPARSAATLALFVALCSGCGTHAPVAGTAPSAPAQPPEAYCLTPSDHPEAVRFHNLNGQVLGSGPVGLVLTNGSANDPCVWHDLLPSLLSTGRYRVLLYFYQADRQQSIADADAGLLQQGAERVILIGQSLGGRETLAAASRIKPPPAAAVSLSGESTPDEVRSLQVPTLIFASEGDHWFPGATARQVFAAIPAVDKDLRVYPGRSHGVDILIEEEGGPALSVFLGFLSRH